MVGFKVAAAVSVEHGAAAVVILMTTAACVNEGSYTMRPQAPSIISGRRRISFRKTEPLQCVPYARETLRHRDQRRRQRLVAPPPVKKVMRAARRRPRPARVIVA